MTSTKGILTILVAATTMITPWTSPSFAQDRKKPIRKRAAQPAEPAKPKGEDESKAPVVQVDKSGRKKVYRIKTEIVIEGRIQKPNAFYVLQRSNINYEWVDLKQEFVPRLLQTVREKPF